MGLHIGTQPTARHRPGRALQNRVCYAAFFGFKTDLFFLHMYKLVLTQIRLLHKCMF